MLTKFILNVIAIGLLSVTSCLAIVPVQDVALSKPDQETKDNSEELIERLQGKWTVTRGKQRWVKEYKGKQEAFSVYDGEHVVYGHAHEIKIEKQGLTQICTTSKNEVTVGPRKGAKLNGFSFIIKQDGDKIFEAVGMLERNNPSGLAPEVIVWERAKE